MNLINAWYLNLACRPDKATYTKRRPKTLHYKQISSLIFPFITNLVLASFRPYLVLISQHL